MAENNPIDLSSYKEKILIFISSFILGFIIWGVFYNISTLLFLILYFLIKKGAFMVPVIVKQMFYLNILSGLLFGIYGVNSLKKQGIHSKIFNVNKENIKFHLIVSSILLVSSLTYNFFISKLEINISLILTWLIVYLIFMLPFSFLLNYTYKNFKQTNYKTILIILIILLNPFFYDFMTGSHLVNDPDTSEELKELIIYQIDERSDLYGENLIGKKVDSINGIEMNNYENVIKFKQSDISQNKALLIIENKEYEITPFYDDTFNIYMLGIHFNFVFCKKEDTTNCRIFSPNK